MILNVANTLALGEWRPGIAVGLFSRDSLGRWLSERRPAADLSA